jgi:transposase-like protein
MVLESSVGPHSLHIAEPQVRNLSRRRCCTCCKRAPADCGHESWPSAPRAHRILCLRRVQLPARRDRPCGALVPPLGLSYRDVEELLAERSIEVDHVTVYRWVQRFTPLLAEAARPCRHAVGQRWFVDETYVKVGGRWRFVYRAIDQFGQVIDVFVSTRRDSTAARRFFERAIGTTKTRPVEVVTDRAPTYPLVVEELVPAAWHRTDRYANNRIEADHGRLKARLRPMRGLKQHGSASVIIAGHAFVQNVRRGYYELAVEEPAGRRLAVAFDGLAMAI